MPSVWGRIAAEEWSEIRSRRPHVESDAFVVMPNHIHGILLLHGDATKEFGLGEFSAPQRDSLGAIVGGYKAGVTRRIRLLEQMQNQQVWQRNYFDRIIRSEAELEKFRAYIADNPRRWAHDPENPER